MLSIAVLGEIEATRGGVVLPLPTGKTRELLARLAVRPGEPVRVDTLVEDLWGVPVDRNTLQAKVSQLRRALGDKDVVRGSTEAYVLDVDPGAVDASRATELARAVSAAAAAGLPAEVVAAATSGIALFRGTPLAGQRDWAAPHRTALDEVRWTMVEELVSARVALGAGGELVPELERLVDEQPLRERLWAALMTALYRAGRQADALAAYSRARTHLVEELGIEPGPALREVEAQVLAQSHARGPVAPDATSPPTNLPVPRSPIVGRDAELRDLEGRLEAQRLVTLTGLAGVGKTRLAVEAALTSPPAGGSWIVRLDSVPSTAGLADLVEAVAAALHVVPDRGSVLDRLRGAPTLLVLDNCEHVVEAAAELAQVLHDGSPWLRMLATSQLPLGIEHEEVVAVAPLATASAVAMFDQLVARSGRTTASPELVAEVCTSLDGLPLAIELAASRVRSLPLDEIARRLDDRFTLLRDPSRPSGRRHALEAALSWSYDLLFPDDQRALQALACFAGGATLRAAEAVMAALGVPAPAAADSLGRLVDRSLVVLDTAVAPRYRLLDSVRTYSRDRLRESGLEAAAMAAHGDWYADQAAQCAEAIRGPEQAAWLDVVRAERADVDAALAWSAEHDTRAGERIVLGLGWAWAVLGDGAAGAARIRSAVEDTEQPEDRVRAGLTAAWLEASAGDLALAHHDWDVARAVPVTDPRLQADVAWCHAFLAIQDGRPADVVASAAEALAAYRGLGLTWDSAAALLLMAYGSLMVGDAVTAGLHAHQAMVLVEETGDRWGLLHARGILAGVAAGGGRLLDAAAEFGEAASAATAMGFVGQAALHLASRARLLVVLDAPAADAAIDEALDAATTVGDGRVAAELRLHAAQRARVVGDAAEADRLLRANIEWFGAHGGGERAAISKVLLAANADDAQTLTALLDASPDPAARQTALDALARLAATSGDPARAAVLKAEADAVVVPAPDIVLRADRRLAARREPFN